MSRLLAAALGGALSLAALAPLPAAADPAHDALARYAAYIGQPAGLHLTYERHRIAQPSSTSSAPAPSQGAQAADRSSVRRTLTMVRRGPLYRYSRLTAGIGDQEGFVGSMFWLANENGFARRAYEGTARQMLTENAVETGQFDGATVVSRSTATIDGRTADTVRVTPNGGTAADLAIDRQNGALLQVTYDPENPYERSTQLFGDYREIAPGVHVAGWMGTKTARWELAKGTAGAVADDELKIPTPTSRWAFGSGAPAPIDLIDHGSGGRAVHVHAAVNGHDGTFLLDSGASGIVLFKDFAKAAGVDNLAPAAYSGVNGREVKASYGRAKSIGLAGSTLSDVVVLNSSVDSEVINGILGYDVLAAALVDVDLNAKTISILDPEKFGPTVGKGAVAFPVDLSTGQPALNIQAAGQTFHPIIDTGNDFLLVLSEDARKSGRLVPLNESIKIGGVDLGDYRVYVGGVDGTSAESLPCARLISVNVGPYKYSNALTCFGNPNVYGRDGGLLGFDFLRHFNWTFDYPEGKLVLTPNGL